jgi:hypothetical protein
MLPPMTVSIVLGIITFVWFELTTVVDLKPLNNVAAYTKREVWLEASVNAAILALVLVLTATGNPATAAWIVGVWLGVQLLTWYPAYLTGRPRGQAEDLIRHHAGTICVLPAIKDHPNVPVHQLILQLLSAALFVSLVV